MKCEKTFCSATFSSLWWLFMLKNSLNGMNRHAFAVRELLVSVWFVKHKRKL